MDTKMGKGLAMLDRDCSFCDRKAVYDAKGNGRINGTWAYMCETHLQEFGAVKEAGAYAIPLEKC
jgi:hypothetical protein